LQIDLLGSLLFVFFLALGTAELLIARVIVVDNFDHARALVQ